MRIKCRIGGRPPKEFLERFWNSTEKLSNGCIRWTLSPFVMRDHDNRMAPVGRVAFRVQYGYEPPSDRRVHRTCKTLHCVNGKHLALGIGTRAESLSDDEVRVVRNTHYQLNGTYADTARIVGYSKETVRKIMSNRTYVHID
jgi:hypothetical protein